MLNANQSYDFNEDTGRFVIPVAFDYYYYAVQEEEDPWGEEDTTRTVVYLTPSEYFDIHDRQWDQYTPMEDNLPETLDYIAEGMYTFNGTVEEAKSVCAELGIKFSQEFQDYL